jgi:hypothetical protein
MRSKCSRLFATAFKQFRNAPLTAFDASGHRRSASDCAMKLAKVIIREIERDRSFKVFQFFVESVGQPGQLAAVQAITLLLSCSPLFARLPITHKRPDHGVNSFLLVSGQLSQPPDQSPLLCAESRFTEAGALGGSLRRDCPWIGKVRSFAGDYHFEQTQRRFRRFVRVL